MPHAQRRRRHPRGWTGASRKAFEHQTDALRWAEEQRVINAEAAR